MYIVVVADRRAHTDLNTHHCSHESQRGFLFVAVPPNVFVRESMFHLWKFIGAEADTVLIAGSAGGFLGITCMGTRRGGFFGASFGAFSAVFGIARAAARSDGRFKPLESSIGTLGTDLAGGSSRAGHALPCAS